jgi:acetate kinase
MLILTINAGSSSLKLSIVDSVAGLRRHSLQVTGIAGPTSRLIIDGVASGLAHGITHDDALQIILKELATDAFALDQVTAAGHRVVHGGEAFTQTVLIDDDVERRLSADSALAPLHNPANVAGIRALRAALPNIPHLAVFDTSFHATLPRRARTYALPPSLQSQFGLRRFGFHGISHAWVARSAANHLGAPLDSLRLVTCHLGHGASVTAVEFGRSIDTSMGMTPLEGLVMGTRAGDIDAGILLRLQRAGMSTDKLEQLLNFESGLFGMTGSSDMAAIEQRAAQGDDSCRLALHVFTHRIRRYIGAMSAVVGGPDAIVFTGGIGENSPYIRHRVTQGLDFIGAHLDEDLNRVVRVTADTPVGGFSTDASRVKLLVAAADEDLAISADVAQFLRRATTAPQSQEHIPIAVSGRHVHLCQRTVDALFGPGYSLTPLRQLGQPGQFAAAETVTLIGPRGMLEKVRIIGPTRDADQIEISRSDEFILGVDAPIRLSGKLDGTPGITLRGPLHTITLRHGVICSHRHIHMTSADATRLGVSHGEVVAVAVHGTQRSLSFGDVLVRVSAVAKLEMHIDTDEANAAGLDGPAGPVEGEFVRIPQTVTLAESGRP